MLGAFELSGCKLQCKVVSMQASRQERLDAERMDAEAFLCRTQKQEQACRVIAKHYRAYKARLLAGKADLTRREVLLPS